MILREQHLSPAILCHVSATTSRSYEWTFFLSCRQPGAAERMAIANLIEPYPDSLDSPINASEDVHTKHDRRRLNPPCSTKWPRPPTIRPGLPAVHYAHNHASEIDARLHDIGKSIPPAAGPLLSILPFQAREGSAPQRRSQPGASLDPAQDFL